MMSMMTPYYTRTLRTRNAMPARSAFPFNDEFFRSFFGEAAAPAMKVDVEDKGDSYLLLTDLPGMKKEDVRISVEDGVLTIAAEQKTDEKEENKENKDRNFVYRERRMASMSRSFSLEGVNEEGITAEFTDGVLHLTLPKKTQEVQKVKTIEIK